ncbi:MAG TPA: PEP/pyruvate-binding domain-containing protein [Roseiflexaceae bacterium]|nr:PEP/pyruvate-binding domain-containing protein [Roseiflexaceae bacterium]
MNLLWLEQPAAQQIALVGGKAANLSRLAAGYRVPSGFCLTTAAFERAHRAGPNATLPSSLYAELAAAYRRLAALTDSAEPQVAVRSSAIDEDGDTASFAGQHETYLNVAGVDAIAAAVQRCWMSALAPRALTYRRERGLATDRVRLAVLIQQLVAADVAAVVFSANPLTGARDEVVINASWGLGESIVGGTVTPDTYVARKDGGALLSRTLAEKRRMTVAVPSGTREVDVPRLLQAQPTLSDAQVAEMAELAGSLEQRTGWPVDIECAYAGGALYLLQCRPITTLPRVDLHARAAA